jgi:hypothetical protein
LSSVFALERFQLVADVDRHVRGEHLELPDPESRQAVEHLFGELIALADQQVGLGALGGQLGLLGLGLRRIRVGGFTGQRDVLGDDRANHFPQVGPALALAHEIQLTNAEEEAEDVAVPRVPEGTQQRRRRELLLLVDVDVDDVVNVDGELDPRAAERNDPRRNQALPVRVRRLLEDHAR